MILSVLIYFLFNKIAVPTNPFPIYTGSSVNIYCSKMASHCFDIIEFYLNKGLMFCKTYPLKQRTNLLNHPNRFHH